MAVLDVSLIETFQRDGFVVVEDFFDFHQLDLFGGHRFVRKFIEQIVRGANFRVLALFCRFLGDQSS